MGVTTVIFLAVGVRLFQARQKIWMKARSPKLVLLSVLFLYLDIIGNTFIFSGKNGQKTWKFTCNLSIVTTTVFFYGILMVYFLRMYRIEQVCIFYKEDLRYQLNYARKMQELEGESAS